MKNCEKVLQKIGINCILEYIAERRLGELNPYVYLTDQDYFHCDNGNKYYWKGDALKAEIKWLKADVKEGE